MIGGVTLQIGTHKKVHRKAETSASLGPGEVRTGNTEITGGTITTKRVDMRNGPKKARPSSQEPSWVQDQACPRRQTTAKV